MTSPRQQVSQWLANFGSALDRADLASAVEMFDEDSYWRDLVSFTWNIITLEGKHSIKVMLDATANQIVPGGWQIDGEATVDNDITEG